VEYAAYVLSENLAEAALALGLVSFAFWLLDGKITWSILSAVAIGYAALTRPTYQLLAFSIGLYIVAARFLCGPTLQWKNVIKGTVILTCGTFFMLAGYAFLTYRSTGYFAINRPTLGLSLTQKTLRVLERSPDEYAAVKDILISARNSAFISREEHTGYSYIDSAMPALMRATGLRDAELSDYLLRLNLLLIQKAPLTYLQDVLWAFAAYWLPSSGQVANMNSHFLQLLWGVTQILLTTTFALSLMLIVGSATYIKCAALGEILPSSDLKSVQMEGLVYGAAATIVMYNAFVTCLIQEGIARFRVPTDALIIFMIFLGLHLWSRLVNLSRKRLISQLKTPKIQPTKENVNNITKK